MASRAVTIKNPDMGTKGAVQLDHMALSMPYLDQLCGNTIIPRNLRKLRCNVIIKCNKIVSMPTVFPGIKLRTPGNLLMLG